MQELGDIDIVRHISIKFTRKLFLLSKRILVSTTIIFLLTFIISLF